MLWALVFAKALVLVYAESLVSGICRESGPGMRRGWSQCVDCDGLGIDAIVVSCEW